MLGPEMENREEDKHRWDVEGRAQAAVRNAEAIQYKAAARGCGDWS